MKRQSQLIVAAVIALLSMMQPAAAQGYSGTDLRDVRVGMDVKDLPDTGYVNFGCAADLNRSITGWSGWRDCPADADGLHGVRFGFDPETSRDGTMVAGHPVVLTTWVDPSGTVAALQIDTDPKARLYLRKKAFLLGPQVKARYGADGWACTQGQLEGSEQPVGGVFIKERCTKTLKGRSLVVDRNLFRRSDQDARSFTDETRVTIRQVKG